MGSVRLAMGSTFAGDYRVNRVLFEAEDRAVYGVEQVSTGKSLALKILAPELVPDEASKEQFLEGARIGARVGTVHILDVRAAGVDEASKMPWMVSELLEGENLDQALGKQGGRSPLENWDELLSQVLHGLAAVHAAGMCHGGLNGASIFLAKPSEVGEPFRVELLDFGVPYSARMKAISQATRLPWVAPEQLAGEAPSPRSDVWSVGLLAFRLLAGKPYFKATGEAALTEEIKAGAAEPASARARALGATAALPKAFDAWFERCTRRTPQERFASAAEALEGAADLFAEVSGVQGEIEEAPEEVKKKPPPLPPMVRVLTENPKPAFAAIALLILVALGGGFGMGLLRSGESKNAADKSRTQAVGWTKSSIDECQKACDGGDLTACHGLGQIFQLGIKTPKDDAKAVQLFKKACDKSDAPACASLAQAMLNGEGTPRSPSQAATLYQKACDDGDGVSCSDLADMYVAGNGVPKDEKNAALLRQKACKLGMTEVCKP